jgi:H+/Cl- antiporter ClcA
VSVGILTALIVVVARRFGAALDRRGRTSMPLLLVAGGLAVGLLAQTADWLGASSQDVLFSGQASVPGLVTSDSTKIVLILFAAKAIAYGISLGSGFRGGPVFPAIFLGIALASLTVAAFDVSPTLAVAVGTAAGMAAQARLIVTPVLLAALLVGSNGLDTVSAAVLATAGAILTMSAIERRPVREGV